MTTMKLRHCTVLAITNFEPTSRQHRMGISAAASGYIYAILGQGSSPELNRSITGPESVQPAGRLDLYSSSSLSSLSLIMWKLVKGYIPA